jgi:hypothetical protein
MIYRRHFLLSLLIVNLAMWWQLDSLVKAILLVMEALTPALWSQTVQDGWYVVYNVILSLLFLVH